MTGKITDFKTVYNWHKNKVCLIGDAAHAMTPNLGQGACQAIEDAYVLSECIKRHNGISEAFKIHQELRYKKACRAVEMGRKIGAIS